MDKSMNELPMFSSLDEPIPALRPTIEIIPLQEEDEKLIVLRDASGYSRHFLPFPPESLALLSFFDGERTVNNLVEEIVRHTNREVDPAPILGIIQLLDSAYFLQNPRSDAHIDAVDHDFREARVMHAPNAGRAYPDDPEELRAFLDAIIIPDPDATHEQPVGVLLPHIDLRIGPTVYAAGYRELENQDFDTYIILGVSHYEHDDFFILTEKDIETPLGVIPTDQEFVRLLRKNSGDVFTSDDLPHMFEHSIEFQALMLQQMFGNDRVRIVPVLCGSLEFMHEEKLLPADNAHYMTFITAMQKTLAESGRKACFLVSVDWSHIGRKFGDELPAAAMLDDVRVSDMSQLTALEEVDYPEFHRLVQETENVTSIDGFACISAFFDIVGPASGRLLKYEQWHEEERESAVTFASMAFYK